MPITGTVPVTAPIAPTLETATYAVTDPIYGKGSLRTVANTTQRDAITQARREKGMLVYVVNDGANGRYYSLIGGTGNEHWTEFNSGGGIVGDYVESVNGLTGVVVGVVRFTAGTTAPDTNVQVGHKWLDTSSGTEFTYIYDGDTYQWVDIAGGGAAGGGFGATGPTGPQLLIIDSFSTNLPRVFLKGSGYTVIGSDKNISVTYEGGLVPATGAVYLTNPTKGTGFPVYFGNSGMTGINFTTQTLTGNIGEAITLRLVVTGADGSGDKYDYTVFMGNEFRWGATTGSSLTAGDLSTTLTNSAVVTGPNIDFTLSTLITQYAYYAYPKSMGQTRQSINNASYGGMVLQGHDWTADAGGLSSFNHSNSLGYAEDFYVYRSDHLYIGRNAKVRVYEEPA
jgi:hypothetical protein